VVITHIFETHLHNDYVTGGLALAEATGAAYHVNAADPVAFRRVPVSEGDVIAVSPSLQVRVLATPGHTFTHLSYVLEADGQCPAVFTGGSLLYGSTGRPDLLGHASTGTLARAQYTSANRLAAELPERTGIYPTHGFGSFCSAAQAEGESSTIGRERRVNPALTLGERPLTILGDTPEAVAEAQRELVRIGIDRPAAAATCTPAEWAGGRCAASPWLASLPWQRSAITVPSRCSMSAGTWNGPSLTSAEPSTFPCTT
jgi:hypothetical protein